MGVVYLAVYKEIPFLQPCGESYALNTKLRIAILPSLGPNPERNSAEVCDTDKSTCCWAKLNECTLNYTCNELQALHPL